MIKEIEQYMIDFLEVPHQDFSGLPPCPFARRERLDKRILYREGRIGEAEPEADLINEIEKIASEDNPRTIIYFDVNIDSSVSQVYQFAQHIIDSCVSMDILAIPIHPYDNYTMNGVKTRTKAPTVFVLIQVQNQVTQAKEKLLRTSYYANNEDEEEKKVQIFCDMLYQKTGAELVTVWWKEHVLHVIQKGEDVPEPVVGSTVDVLDRNGVYRWLKRFGTMHGWNPLCRFKKRDVRIERACKNGDVVICSGFGGENHGHLSLLIWSHEEKTVLHEPLDCPVLENLLAQGCWIWRPEDVASDEIEEQKV